MKFQFLILFGLVAVNVQAQKAETFLMYERISGQSINDATGEVLEDLTGFVLHGIFTKKYSKAITRQFISIDKKEAKKEKWEVDISGTGVRITNRSTKLDGRILVDPIVDSALFEDLKVDFLLFPVEPGISLPPLKGRYTVAHGNDDNSSVVTFAKIIDKGIYKGLQETSFEWKFDNSSGVDHGLTKYSNSKYNNLIYVGGYYRFLQPIGHESEAVTTFNLFPAEFDRPVTIKSWIKLLPLRN